MKRGDKVRYIGETRGAWETGIVAEVTSIRPPYVSLYCPPIDPQLFLIEEVEIA